MGKRRKKLSPIGGTITLDLMRPPECPAGIAVDKPPRDLNAATDPIQGNVSALRDTLCELQSQGVIKFIGVEIPANAASAPKMTLKQFRDAYANKPGATFHCPDHLKHELDNED